jgi:hypothetical protein
VKQLRAAKDKTNITKINSPVARLQEPANEAPVSTVAKFVFNSFFQLMFLNRIVFKVQRCVGKRIDHLSGCPATVGGHIQHVDAVSFGSVIVVVNNSVFIWKSTAEVLVA